MAYPTLWGSMLTGVAQGFQQQQQQQEDQAFTRQQRANQLAGQQLSNQSQSMWNQAYAQQLQNADLTRQFAQQGLQDASNPSGYGQSVARSAAPSGSSGVLAASQSSGPPASPSGPMSMQQLAKLDAQNGLPAGTMYGVMDASSSGSQPSPEVGLPGSPGSESDKPVYGLKPFDPKDPQAAASYLGLLYKKSGGNMQQALAWYGGSGRPTPETSAFSSKAAQGGQAFSQAYSLDQSRQQPTPADQVSARDAAGLDTPIPVYQQSLQAQNQQIRAARASAQRAQQSGYPQLAAQFNAQADKLQDQQLDLQKKYLGVQVDANKQIADDALGVRDQSSYDNFRQQIAQNPSMQAAAAGLGLTGDYDLDRNKVQALAGRTEALKDQQANQIKQAELQIKQQAEQRAQQKADQPLIAQQQAQQQDTMRRRENTAKGIPFAPSIRATAPVGTTPSQMEQAQKLVQSQNSAYDRANSVSSESARNVATLASRAYTMVQADRDPATGKPGSLVGGWLIGPRQKLSSGGYLSSALNDNQQELVKLTNQMVLEAAKMLPPGAQRSAFTAATQARIEGTKPNLSLHPEAFLTVARDYYMGAVAQNQMGKFLDEYTSANPGATKESGLVQWRHYEQSMPTEVFSASEGKMVPNMSFVPTLEDGSPNDKGPMAYRDYHVFFSNGGRW